MNTKPTPPPDSLGSPSCCASLVVNAACRANTVENETQDLAQCPHCGSQKDPWFSRVIPMSYHCQDCGKDVNDTIDIEGQWTLEKCPKCSARMLKNNLGDRWCSYVNCSHSILHNMNYPDQNSA